MSHPPVRYAKSGSLNIAYQVTGGGPVDLVLISGFVSHLDLDWAHPQHAHFLERLGSFARLIRFDKRGTGLSDRPGGLPDLEARMDDVRAVMDAADCERAILFGYSEGGPMAVLFAATYPERIKALILYGTYAKRIRSDDYPWATTAEDRARYGEEIESEWGWEADMHTMCPSADEAMAAWWGERARAAASPGAARALIEMNSLVDVRDVLPAVKVPTLVMHRTADRDSRVEEGRYIAGRIPGARFIELSGGDHFVSVDPDQILDPVEEFVTGHKPVKPAQSKLATILFVDIVGSTAKAAALGDHAWKALLEKFFPAAARQVGAFNGRLVNTAGDGFLATFDGPARAIRCALALAAWAPTLDLAVRCGIHTAEIEETDRDIAGIGVHVASRICTLASPGEVWVSRTVRDLVSGSGLALEDRGSHTLKGIEEPWALYVAAN